MVFRRRHSALRLGVKGSARSGPYAGRDLFVDSVGMTPVDPLAVLVSPELERDHPEQLILWVNPEDIDSTLRSWRVAWGERDDAIADRLQSLVDDF